MTGVEIPLIKVQVVFSALVAFVLTNLLADAIPSLRVDRALRVASWIGAACAALWVIWS